MTEPQLGHKPLVVNAVVVGPFEEEMEEVSITSDGARGKPPRATLSQLEPIRTRISPKIQFFFNQFRLGLSLR